MTKTEELLAVLDMPEEEQADWFKNNGYKEYVCVDIKSFTQKLKFNALFADLAFRLRDEVQWETAFYSAMLDVQNYAQEDSVRAMDYKFWAFAQPIHWIIAALIAKQKEKQNGK